MPGTSTSWPRGCCGARGGRRPRTPPAAPRRGTSGRRTRARIATTTWSRNSPAVGVGEARRLPLDRRSGGRPSCRAGRAGTAAASGPSGLIAPSGCRWRPTRAGATRAAGSIAVEPGCPSGERARGRRSPSGNEPWVFTQSHIDRDEPARVAAVLGEQRGSRPAAPARTAAGAATHDADADDERPARRCARRGTSAGGPGQPPHERRPGRPPGAPSSTRMPSPPPTGVGEAVEHRRPASSAPPTAWPWAVKEYGSAGGIAPLSRISRPVARWVKKLLS